VRQILAIAGNTIKEGLRNKMFYILLGVALLFVLMGRACMGGSMNIQNRELSPEQMVSFGTTIGFFIITFWGLTLAGLLSTGAILSDIETGVITTFISKPISRFEYLLGKFIGVLAVVLLNVVVLAVGFSILAFLRAGVFPFSLFAALGIFALNIILLISFIFLVSLITSRVIAMVFGILGYVLSTAFDILVYFDTLRDKMVSSASALWKVILDVIYFAIPQWGSTWFYSASFINDFFSQSMSFWPVVHTLLYICLIWIVTVFVFSKKEF
jgi:ABC-type transport system involved in multi-copper enzyme maturation permease subunit